MQKAIGIGILSIVALGFMWGLSIAMGFWPMIGVVAFSITLATIINFAVGLIADA